MDKSFRNFLDTYLASWRSSNLADLAGIIAEDYQAREIRNGEIVDFGYGESLSGWEQGFKYVLDHNGHWQIAEISTVTLRERERLVIFCVTLVIDGKAIGTGSLFFQTFKQDYMNTWKLIRSYIETGIPAQYVKEIQPASN
ncbi:flavoprotein [Peribacillus sp. SCS-37]|uniref:flavoprotein n=1 Tax=Paraperibacillus esterisolvens TaxID=3115296 RepID=UPI0039064B5D